MVSISFLTEENKCHWYFLNMTHAINIKMQTFVFDRSKGSILNSLLISGLSCVQIPREGTTFHHHKPRV